jgi:hypothetical protein
MNIRLLTTGVALALTALPITASAGEAGVTMCMSNSMSPRGPFTDASVARQVCQCVIGDLSHYYTDGQQDMLFRALYWGKEMDGREAFVKRFYDARAKCGDR